MISEPITEYRRAQYYISLKAKVKQNEIPAQLPPNFILLIRTMNLILKNGRL
jgi:hypothetical protein